MTDEHIAGVLWGVLLGIAIVVSMLMFQCGSAEPACRGIRAFMCSGPK